MPCANRPGQERLHEVFSGEFNFKQPFTGGETYRFRRWWMACFLSHNHHLRSFKRRMNFNPDQMSVIAHTFTSTRPTARPVSRTIFSVTLVATPELFFGQLTQNIPAGESNFATRLNSDSNSFCVLVNVMAKSTSAASFERISHFASSDFSSFFTSGALLTRRTRKPSLIPNFFGSGVPEYPGMRIFYCADGA